jgi:hypothetical protein
MATRYTIRINQGRFLPAWLRITISASLVAVIVFVIKSFDQELAVGFSVILAIPVLPLWNSFFILEIDNLRRRYKKGIWIAGWTFGKWVKYNKIVDIKIRKKSTKKYSLREGKSFKAILILDDETQVYLLGDSSQEVLSERMEEVSRRLGIEQVI